MLDMMFDAVAGVQWIRSFSVLNMSDGMGGIMLVV